MLIKNKYFIKNSFINPKGGLLEKKDQSYCFSSKLHCRYTVSRCSETGEINDLVENYPDLIFFLSEFLARNIVLH